MKAVVCTRYGPPEVLQFSDVPKPTPKDDEILVKVHATTVSVADSRCRSFNVPPSFWIPARLALGVTKLRNPVLGAELSGVVESVGKNITQFRPGDKVFATTGHKFGGYAEYVCLAPESNDIAVAHMPSNANFEQAAAVPLGAQTALYFIREARLMPGQKVLIYGASGSLGTYAVQLAKHFGADVTGVCSSANLNLVRSLGADHVIDYTSEDFTKNGQRYDVIFDAVGKAPFAGCVRSLTDEGTLLHSVAVPAVTLRMKWNALTSRKRFVGGGPASKNEDLVFLKELIEAGHLRPVIDRIMPMEQIVDAHRYLDTGRKRGNVVITVG